MSALPLGFIIIVVALGLVASNKLSSFLISSTLALRSKPASPSCAYSGSLLLDLLITGILIVVLS